MRWWSSKVWQLSSKSNVTPVSFKNPPVRALARPNTPEEPQETTTLKSFSSLHSFSSSNLPSTSFFSYSDAHVKDIWHFCRVLCNPLPGWVKEKGKEIIINTNAVIQRSFKEGNYKYSTVWDNYYNFVWFPPDVLMRGYSLQIVYSLSKRRPPLTKKGISSKLIAMDLGTLTRFLVISSTISNLLLNRF